MKLALWIVLTCVPFVAAWWTSRRGRRRREDRLREASRTFWLRREWRNGDTSVLSR